MASNSYTSANVTPSSDTFREWVDLTNRITYDMEKYVVSTAPAGNTQGAETIGNAHVNGYFGANTVMIFDGVAGATGNTTHYGTRAPAADLIFHTNAVFADDGTNTSIIHAQSNVHGTNSGIQFTSNTTESAITINTTADVFESNAGINKFNTIMDVNANVDIDNDLVTINSGNVYVNGNSTAGEFNIDSNTVFTANVNITSASEDLNISSDQVIITSDTALFKSTATLNDFDSDLDIDNDLTDIAAVDFNLSGTTADITSTTLTASGTTANLDSTTTNINGTLLDINSATVDVDSATAVNFNSPDVGINGAVLDINSETVDVDSTTAVNFNSPDVGINGALLDINSTTVDVDSTTVDITSTDINLSGTNTLIDSTNTNIFGKLLTVTSNVDVDNALTDINATDFNLTGTTADITSTTLTVSGDTANVNSNVDINNALTDITSTDINLSGTNTLIDSTNTNILGELLKVTSNVDVDASLVDITSTDINLSGTNTLIDSTNTNIHGKLLDVTSNVTVNAASVYIDSVNTTIGEANTDILNVISNTKLHDKLNVVKNVDFDANLNVDGNQQLDGTLKVGGDTHLQTTANVDGLLTAKDNFHLTGTANVSVKVNVGSNVHVNTTAFKAGTGEGILVASNGSLEIGNSTVFTSATMANVETTGTLTVAGHTDLNNTLNVNGIGTFEDTTDSGSKSSGSVVVAGGAGIVKSVVIGQNLTVEGDTSIQGNTTLGDAGTDGIAFVGKSTTNLIPVSNADLSIGSASLTWDVHGDDIRTRVLTASGNVQVDGHLDVEQSANVGYPFEVSNASTTAFVVQTRNGGADREIVVGNTVPNASHSEDRLVIRSGVGNSTIGLLPLHGNNVVLGDTTHRWILSANSGNFSGAVTVTDTTQSSSNATGSAKLAGGLGVTKKVYIGQDLVVEAAANIASLLTAKTDVNITQEANTSTLRVRSNSNLEGTLQVAGDLTANSNVTLGNASSDVIKFVGSIGGNSTAGIIPSATGRILGTDTKRFKAAFTTANTSGDITAGADVDITGEANTDTLSVRETAAIAKTLATGNTTVTGFVNATTTIQSGGDVTVGANAGIAGSANVGTNVNITTQANTNTLRVRSTSTFEDATLNFGNSTIHANLSSNSTQVKFETGHLEATDLVISGSATLPEDTTLVASTLGTANLTVTDTAEFTAATDGASIKFGNLDDQLILNFANAVVNTNFIADGTTRDIGTNAARWGEGHFEDLLQVGGSGGIVLSDSGGSSTANVTADNIIARDDLIAASSSDRDLKTNLLKIDTAIDKVEELGGYEFEWNSNIGDERIGTKEYGVIAQEVEQILPHAVKINSRGYRTVNYNSLIPLLIEAVKELSGKVEELERNNRKEDLDG